jgi:hypothetical protein
MSFYAEVMQAVRFTEEQNKLILAGNLPNAVLAERFGRGIRAVQRQRALLKRLQKEEQGQ